MTVADRIRLRREALGLTQEELAEKIGYEGKSSISKLENSGDKVTLKKIAKIAPFLHTSKEYLLGWVKNPDPDYPQTKLGMIEEEISKTQISSDIIQVRKYLDEEVLSVFDAFIEAGGSKAELITAIRLYNKLQNASPEIKTAIEALLKAK